MSRRKMTRRGGLVYSTERGEMCPTCGYPKTDCKCSSKVSGTASPTGGAVRVEACRPEHLVSLADACAKAGVPLDRGDEPERRSHLLGGRVIGVDRARRGLEL